MSDAALAPARGVSRIAEVLADASLGGQRIELPAMSVLYHPFEPARNLYLVESGEIRIHQIGPDGTSTRLADILGPGDWFGVAALARSAVNHSREIAVSPSVLWVFPAGRLLELLAQRPQMATELVGQLASRLQSAHDAAARLVFDDCNKRLIRTLVKFSHTAAATRQEGGGVVLRITHQQLAQAVGAARETVSLALTQLRLRNLLRTGRNRLFFDPQALEQFSHSMEQPRTGGTN